MSIKLRDESEFYTRDSSHSPYSYKSCLLDGISEPFAGVWFYRVFDVPEDLEEIGLSEIEDSWDTVGECIRSVMLSYSEANNIPPYIGKDKRVVQR